MSEVNDTLGEHLAAIKVTVIDQGAFAHPRFCFWSGVAGDDSDRLHLDAANKLCRENP